MFNSRLISLIRKEFIQILRDPRTLVLVLVIPIMQLFLLGYAATTDVRNGPSHFRCPTAALTTRTREPTGTQTRSWDTRGRS